MKTNIRFVNKIVIEHAVFTRKDGEGNDIAPINERININR